MKLYIHAFGCQMNKLDAEMAVSALKAAGYSQTEEMEEADVILFHTCSVREHAEERVYSNVGKLKFLKRRRPEIVIGIMGCMAQKDQGGIFERLPHVDLVIGTREFPRVAELVEEARRTRAHLLACSEETTVIEARDVTTRPSRHQAYLTIMRGCDNYCAYCIVPSVRGREISRPVDDVLEEARRLAGDGVIEITLLGQNVNSYGKSFNRPGALVELLEGMEKIPGLARVRFVTSHPKDMTREILQAARDLPRVCEHLHMPAQAGSDRVLKAMNRKYTSAHYRDLVAMAREIVPEIAIASDFIVGFPGETPEEFDQTAALVRDLQFQNSFVFKYSPRPGTASAKLADDVSDEEKKRRNMELLEIQSRANRKAHAAFIGREVEVLVEGVSARDPRRVTGRLRTNQIVAFPGGAELAGQLVNVRILSATALTLVGEKASTSPSSDLGAK